MQITLTESNVFEYLESQSLLSPGEGRDIEPAGDGNINWVQRVRARDGSSWILKQARPALERFPEYQVSTERIAFEARYFETVRPLVPEPEVCPVVVAFDDEARVLILEDLGNAERLDDALARNASVDEAVSRIATFLGAVHAKTRDRSLARHFMNGEMQRLHGDHIFRLPYHENDFPLSTAISRRAQAIRADATLVATIEAAYTRYLEPRGALVHADVQAGNILLAERGPVLLDAEIAHIGDPAFDIGIHLAHVLLPAIARGEQRSGLVTVVRAWDAYLAAHGANGPAFRDVARYAGIELLRRTIGAARTSAVASDEAGEAVLDMGLSWVSEPPEHPR